MQWFKSKIEHAVEKAIAKKIDNLMEQEDNDDVPSEKPYMNVKLVNDVLTIVLHDGSILSKPNATEEDFNRAINAVTEAQLFSVCTTAEVLDERRKQEAEIKRIKALQQGIQRLEGLNDFEIEGNSVKLRGTGRTMPQLLVERFVEIVDAYDMDPYNHVTDDEEYQALKRFFMWCCLNPRAEVANELYRFLKENSFRITKQGFFVALRNVVTLHGSTDFVQFVSNTYNKVKAVWKKSPDNYEVYLKDGEYSFIHKDDRYKMVDVDCDNCDGSGEVFDYEEDENYPCLECDGEGTYQHQVLVSDLGEHLGNLTELYLDLPNRKENRFTDDWTKTFDIRIGRVVNMPTEDCNWSTQDCAAAGLHFTADQIHYVGCGDQSVLVLINPMKVVGIGQHKGRCYEYLPIMTVPRDEATSILHDLDFDTLQLDEDYAIRELQNLAEKAKEGFVSEASKHQFNIPAMTHSQIENIVSSLEQMKDYISKRVVNLD
jgi:hypothetical protein